MKKIIFILLAILVAACSKTSEYDSNLKKWQDANVSHYRFQLNIGCFCGFRNDMPLTIEVKDGQIVSITKVDGTLVTSTDQFYGLYSTYSTIDNLFGQLKSELEGTAYKVEVTYDAAYGFPSDVYIDRIKDAADDETSLQVSNFEVLQ